MAKKCSVKAPGWVRLLGVGGFGWFWFEGCGLVLLWGLEVWVLLWGIGCFAMLALCRWVGCFRFCLFACSAPPAEDMEEKQRRMCSLGIKLGFVRKLSCFGSNQ